MAGISSECDLALLLNIYQLRGIIPPLHGFLFMIPEKLKVYQHSLMSLAPPRLFDDIIEDVDDVTSIKVPQNILDKQYILKVLIPYKKRIIIN